ncbi:MAG: recombinase A [Myxococcales bacterium]|nr:recombinase A [Myxococcales bacterium]
MFRRLAFVEILCTDHQFSMNSVVHAPFVPVPGIRTGKDLAQLPNYRDISSHWRDEYLTGRLVELSGWERSCTLTLSLDLALSMQGHQEPVAWISHCNSWFFPPDLEHSVDLDALVVLRLPDQHAAAQAAERLLRSGAFGLVIIDLGAITELHVATQMRLASLAKKHASIVLLLTHKRPEQLSLGSLISLRVHTRYVHTGADCFICELEALKDKQRGPGWKHMAMYSGPEGLR